MGTSTVSIETCAGTEQPYEYLRLHEAEHRHGNNLQILSNLVRHCLREARGRETREVLSSISELIDTMVGLHKLSQDRDDDLAVLLQGMGREWQRLCNGHIRLAVEAETGIELPQSTKTVAVLIAQELVLNAVKHAYPEDRHGTIRIRLYTERDADVKLEIEDDGVGETAVGAKGTDESHHGHSLLNDLSFSLGGTLHRSKSNNGSGQCVTVCWPI